MPHHSLFFFAELALAAVVLFLIDAAQAAIPSEQCKFLKARLPGFVATCGDSITPPPKYTYERSVYDTCRGILEDLNNTIAANCGKDKIYYDRRKRREIILDPRLRTVPASTSTTPKKN